MGRDPQDGYATPAAALIGLAIASVVAATTARAMAELRLAKADLARTQAVYALDAAQNAAMAAISTSTRPPPYRWTMASLDQAVAVLAEPERPKLGTLAAAQLDDTAIQSLGGDDVGQVRTRLTALNLASGLPWIADQAPSARWRACAATFVSPYGAATSLAAPVYSQPQAAQTPSLWRAGEVWRIQVTSTAGWRDERVVRFTGNGEQPAAVIARRLSRTLKGEPKCEDLLKSDAAS